MPDPLKTLKLPRLCTVIGAAVLACAPVATQSPSAAIAALPPLPRSSIASVLEHRADLALTDEQVKRLQDIDDQLEQDNAALRRQLALQRPDGGTHDHRLRDEPSSPADRGMGGSMGGMRGGMGAQRGGGSKEKERPNEKAEEESEAQRKKRLVQHMDDNDTRAFFEAEELLTEAQKQPARNYAGQFRVNLADRREQLSKLQGQ